VKLKVCNARLYTLQPSYLLNYRGLIHHKDTIQKAIDRMTKISVARVYDHSHYQKIAVNQV
jgi:hypothetical protein